MNQSAVGNMTNDLTMNLKGNKNLMNCFEKCHNNINVFNFGF